MGATKKSTVATATELANQMLREAETCSAPGQRMELNSAKVVLRGELEAVLDDPSPEQLARSAERWHRWAQRVVEICNVGGDARQVHLDAYQERLARFRSAVGPLGAHYISTMEKIGQAIEGRVLPNAPLELVQLVQGGFFGMEVATLLFELGAGEIAYQVLEASVVAAQRFAMHQEAAMGRPLYDRPTFAELGVLLPELGRTRPSLVKAGEAAMLERRRARQPLRRGR
jgi:hypothetical protein